MFCPVCGKEGEGLCIDCLLKERPVAMRKIEIPICNCGRYFYRGRWSLNIEHFIEEFVRNNLILPEEISVKSVDVRKRVLKKRIRLKICLSGEYKGKNFDTDLEKEIGIRRVICPKCSRARSMYYEAVLQFRTGEDPIKIIDSEFISNIKKLSNGFDIYITSSRYARSIGKKFEERGFIVKESSRLVGMKEGKKIYRVSISIKEPVFGVGDIIECKGNIFQIVNTGKRYLIKNIETGKKSSINKSSLKNAKPVARGEDIRKGVVTMTTPKEIQILDLDTNETYDVPKTTEIKAGSEVDIVKIKNRIYIV